MFILIMLLLRTPVFMFSRKVTRDDTHSFRHLNLDLFQLNIILHTILFLLDITSSKIHFINKTRVVSRLTWKIVEIYFT